MSGEEATARPFPASQCHHCVHVELVPTKRRITYILCAEPRMPRYPPQPMAECPAFREARRED